MQGLIGGFASGDPSAIQSRRAATAPFALAEGRLSLFSVADNVGDYATATSSAAMQQATEWTMAFKINADRMRNNAVFAAQWNWSTAKSRFIINNDNGTTAVSVYVGDGALNILSQVGRTSAGVLPLATDTELCVVYDGTQATDALRLRLYSRAAGGTWALNTWASIGTIPATMPAPDEPLTLGMMPGFGPQFDGQLWDVRMWSAAVLPSGTSDVSLTSCIARWRWREGVGTTSTDEIGGNVATLTSSFVAPARPGWIVEGWRASVGAKKILALGDSKTEGVPYVGAWREEMVNRLAARWGQNVDMVGRFTDVAGLAAFASNAQHSGQGGATLSVINGFAAADVAAYTPNVVICEGGTNDIVFSASTAAQARDAMGTLIDTVLAGSASCRVVVMTDPLINNAFAATQATYNGLLPALVASKGSRVSLVDLTTIVRGDMLADTLHPSERGYRRIAESIADAVAGVL